MREKHLENRIEDLKIRITPACAGKTLEARVSEMVIRDHPRVCGKNPEKLDEDSHYGGSPPRVREKRKRTS